MMSLIRCCSRICTRKSAGSSAPRSNDCSGALFSPFVLRSVDPPITEVNSKVVRSVRRLGKRIAIGLDDDLFLVVHLMIAGRLRWREPGAKPGVGPKMVLAFLEFENGTLLFT